MGTEICKKKKKINRGYEKHGVQKKMRDEKERLKIGRRRIFGENLHESNSIKKKSSNICGIKDGLFGGDTALKKWAVV